MMNVLNGGAHADNKVDFQEFMIVPAAAPRASPSACGSAPRSSTTSRRRCTARGLGTAVGDEGGFAPDLESNEAALEMLVEAIEAAGYRAGRGRRDRARPGDERDLRRRGLRARARGPQPRLGAALADYWADLAGALPDRLDRGRHGRGGLGRLEGADRPHRRARPARRRRPLRDEHRAPRAGHRAPAWPTRS